MAESSTAAEAHQRSRLKALWAVGGCVALGSGTYWLAGMLGLDQPAAAALVILVLAAALWISEALPLFVTSFVILLLSIVWLTPALEATGDTVGKAQFLAPFFSDIILLFLGGFVLSAALHKYRLDEQMARWIIRHTGGSLPRLMLGVMGVTAFLSMWLSNTATAAMMLALVLPIVEGLPKGALARKGLILCVPFAANAGGLGTPIGSPPNAIALQYLRSLGLEPSFGSWMAAGVPIMVVVLALCWLLLKLLFRVRGRVEGVSCEPLDLDYRSPGLLLVLGGTLLTAVGWLTSGWHGYSAGTVSLFPLILFFGSGLLNVRDLRGLSWDVLLVMGGGLCLGVGISASGLAAWVTAQLPAEALGVYGALVAFGVLACVMSTVMSNTASANLVLPIVLGLGLESISPVVVGVAFACSLAMSLPISTPPNAMAFSSGSLKVMDLFKPGLLVTILGLLLVFTAGYWWWSLIGFV